MQILSFLILLIMLMTPLAGAQVTVAWSNYPGGVSVAVDASNNVYTANWDSNLGGDITLTKRDASGNILWEVPYNNTDYTRSEAATWVETDGAGNILVSGTIRSGYSNPVNAASLLMKYSPAGALLWRVVYESSFDGSSTNKCLVDANNNIYVLGIGTGPIGQVTKVKKFNSSGASVWNYFDTGGGAPSNFKFTPDNNIVIVKRGITGSINTYSKIGLNGNLIWNTAGITSLSGGDASGDTFGNTYIINGASQGSTLSKLSPAGAVIWSKTNTVAGNKVEVGTDNNPVVGGYPVGTYGVVILKYDGNGNLLWQNLDADGPGLSLLALAPMRLDGSNAAYVAGSTMSSMGLCKVNSDGTSAWAATTSSGYPVWFEFGTDNSIYIVGGTTARFTQSGTIPSPPAAPSNLVATPAGTSSIKLTWADNSTNETSFVLMQSSTSGGIFNKLITIPANTTSYTDVGLGSSATYYYKIQATNAGGGSAWSNEANATTAAGPLAPIAAFIGSPTSGCAPLAVNFTDQSTGDITSWAWTFGDGGTSTLQNPSHSYVSSGSYTVSLTVTGPGGSDVESKTGYAAVSAPPTAAFTGSPTSGTAPLTVNFTDQSTGLPTTWSWTFGDGGTATVKNPSHSYSAAGTYTVSLTASNSCGSNLLTKTSYITVTTAQQNAVHIAEMVVTKETSGVRTRGKARVKVVNQSGAVVSGVTVKGNWSGGSTAAATFTTGTDGWGETFSKWVRTTSAYTFCVSSLAKTGYTYDSAANVVSCGKSDGTVWKTLSNISPDDIPSLEEGTGEKILVSSPNPFNPSTQLTFRLSEASDVRLDIYNILGERIITLYDQALDAGTHSTVWDARDDFGRAVGTGTYFYILNINNEQVVRGKLLFIK